MTTPPAHMPASLEAFPENLGPNHRTEIVGGEDLPRETFELLEAINGQVGRYSDHDRRIAEAFSQFPKLDTLAVGVGRTLHDLLDHGILEQSSLEIRRAVSDHVVGWYNEQNEEGRQPYICGLGFAIGTWRWERASERWRGDIGKGITNLRTTDAEEAAGITRDSLDTIAGEAGSSVDTVTRQLLSAISGDKSLLKAGEPYRPEILNRFVPKIVEAGSFFETLDKRDVEALAIKTLEVVDNIKNPPPNNPGAQWRDIIEILNFYSSALELSGREELKEIAAYAKGVALEEIIFNKTAKANARTQHELSSRHFEQIAGEIRGAIAGATEEDGTINGMSVKIERARIKSIGSTAKKLLSDDYRKIEASRVPDGIGFRLLVSWPETDTSLDPTDKITLESADVEQLGEDSGEIRRLSDEMAELLRHTPDLSGWLGENHRVVQIENTIREPRKSGYQAIHVQIEYVADNGEIVPYEIQIVDRQAHYSENTYGPAGWLFYKEALMKDPELAVATLERLGNRVDTLRLTPGDPELNPYTWADIIELFPDMDTPMHRAFGVMKRDGVRYLAPREISDENKLISIDESYRDGFLPPATVREDDFMSLLAMLSPELGRSPKIKQAFELAQTIHAGQTRRNGQASFLEGHILPATIHLVMLTKRSGAFWKLREDGHHENMVIADLLHDAPEDAADDPEVTLEMINREFGPEVHGLVKHSTKDIKISDQANREAIRAYIDTDPRLKLIKLTERLQNHVYDMTQIMIGEQVDQERALAYWEETLEDFGDLLDQEPYIELALATENLLHLAIAES